MLGDTFVNWSEDVGARFAPVSVNGEKARRDVILAIGDVSAWRNGGGTVPACDALAFAEFHEVTGELLRILEPALVVSPLLSRRFDCLDLAQLLTALGYRGKYRVIDSTLPNPSLIVREVRALVPGLDFAVACEAELGGQV